MGAAAAVLTQQEDVRTMAHDALDAWLDHLEAEPPDVPTLREISERFLQTRHTLLSACLYAVKCGTLPETSWSPPAERLC